MKILIAGLAKTGTTGLLYLIVNSHDRPPRMLFEPTACPPDIDDAQNPVVAKILIGPKLEAKSFASFDRKITLVRDPRDRLISSLLYSQFHSNYLDDPASVAKVRDCLRRKEENPAAVSLREILDTTGQVSNRKNVADNHVQTMKAFLDLFDQYLVDMPDTFLYQYEDFVSGHYEPLADFLGLPIRGNAEVPDQLSRVKRTKGYGDWRNWFTEEDVRDYRPIFSPWLAKYGYDPDDWALNDQPEVKPEHCSEYFLRLVAENRAKQARVDAKPGEKRTDGAGKSRSFKGRILRFDTNSVAGWAFGEDPAEHVRVSILLNGRELGEVVADKPRPRLKERGVHPTGNCGFVYRFPPGEGPKRGDQVAVKSANGEVELSNSPVVLEES